MSILAVTDQSWRGVRRALAGITKAFATPRAAVERIERDRPALVVLGCYTPDWRPVVDAAKRCGSRVAVVWYASYVLNDFDKRNREWMIAALTLKRDGVVDFLATPHAGLAASWSRFGFETDVLPAYVSDGVVASATPKEIGVHVGIFGSSQPWKNMDCQIVGASMVPTAVVHVQQVLHRGIADAFGLNLVSHDKLDDQQYYALLSAMTVNLCVTTSESFSYLTAESLLLGTPVLVSTVAPIFSRAPQSLRACVVERFDDPQAIRDGVLRVLDNYEPIRSAGREHMLAVNDHNRSLATLVLSRWLA